MRNLIAEWLVDGTFFAYVTAITYPCDTQRRGVWMRGEGDVFEGLSFCPSSAGVAYMYVVGRSL